ncbi:MAG: SUMF1/EgtB/PvdO family nonheme iron enzyme, partial [Methylococcales bacterium]
MRDLNKIKHNAALDKIKQAIERVEAVQHMSQIEGLAKLSGASGYYRIRIGDYRLGIVAHGDILVFVLASSAGYLPIFPPVKSGSVQSMRRKALRERQQNRIDPTSQWSSRSKKATMTNSFWRLKSSLHRLVGFPRLRGKIKESAQSVKSAQSADSFCMRAVSPSDAFRAYCQLCTVVFVLLLNSVHCGLAHAESDTAQMPRPGESGGDKTTVAATNGPCDSDDNAAPAMVVIRPGRFMMGSPDSEADRSSYEGPQHAVTIPKPFALSRCEITVGQFRRFIGESGYQTTAESNGQGCFTWNVEKSNWEHKSGDYWDNPGFSQNNYYPVVCVSWPDVQRYIDWLSQRTGAVYRLPTEAEWEYSARGDTHTARFFGDKSQCDYANGLAQEAKDIAGAGWILAECRDDFIYTAPVGRFLPNPFGLYDILGNAWERTLDCWHEHYQNAPADGLAWLENDKGD